MTLKLLINPLIISIIVFTIQAIILFNHFGVSSVVEEIPLNLKKTNQQNVHLLKGQKASAAFKATDNNLGILFIPLVKFGQGSDNILFRIKKEGEEKWYHESKFSGDQVKNDELFPLGFPPITNSKNNLYVFELESLAGEYQNGVGIIRNKPGANMYRYSVRDLKDYRTLSSFTYKKLFYVFTNINYWLIFVAFVLSSLLTLFIKNIAPGIPRLFINLRADLSRTLKVIINTIKSEYFLQKRIINSSKKTSHWFTSTKFYSLFLNTNMKKRLAIGLLIFLFAFIYRYSASLVNLDKLFYAGLGGQGDYDQFIRAATCAVKSFCSYAVLSQNFLIETSILGMFYEIFGFIGGLKAYLYLMIILSSIVATLPHFLLSRKSWISLGGIIGSLYLATSVFLTDMALNFPPDNGSLFTFSMFYIVYLLTLHIGTIQWLLFFGIMGLTDGLNKALFLISDLAAFVLFIPVFFFQKSKRINKFPFVKLNSKLILYSVLPLLIFLTIYSVWEYFIQIKFSAPYFLRGLVQSGGASYVAYTSFDDSSFTESIVSQLFYLSVSAVVMVKRLVEYSGLNMFFLAPIFLGLLFFSFVKVKFPVKKFIIAFIISAAIIALLTLIKNNYYGIHKIFEGEYILGTWTDNIYIQIFLFSEIIVLFILNFKYSVIKLSLPIIPYVVMLIILTKNSPFPRISIHVVAWSVILFAFLVDWILTNINNQSSKRIRIILPSLLLILFFSFYGLPKMVTMITQLNSGFAVSQNQVRYLKWVEESLPSNAVILAGGKSDLVRLGENITKPIAYSTLWNAALLIRPNEIPEISPTDFTIISELENKDNFKKKKYVILEDDIYIWRARVTGVADGVFTADPNSTIALHADDYSINVYKFNPTLKKAIYELNLRGASVD